jgi:DNA-binding NarL/FixJ family response regulator
LRFGSLTGRVWLAVPCAAAGGATIQGMARTVLIVDDHPGFRTSARRILEADGYQVVGEAPDGRSGIATARALHPDIVLLDVHLPDLDGFEVAAALTDPDDAPTVVLTSSRDGRDFNGMIARSGARGFIAKAELSGAALEALLR